MSTQNETISGVGKWRMTFEDGEAIMIEIWPTDDTRFLFGAAVHQAPCASCGAITPTITEHNDEATLCPKCENAALYGPG